MIPVQEWKAPRFVPRGATPSVFLAGAIDMGAAEKWQDAVAQDFVTAKPGIHVFNPRRDDWDSSWKQDPDFAPFREQVEWELEMIDRASVVLIHFPASSIAPISLLELGLVAADRVGENMVVSCEPGFHRSGNVAIVCERYGVSLFYRLDEAVRKVRAVIAEGMEE